MNLTASYDVSIPKHVHKYINKLTSRISDRIIARLKELKTTPRPAGAEKLAGYKDYYRVRVGDYRIVYSIRDEQLLILVVRVGARKEVYRNL